MYSPLFCLEGRFFMSWLTTGLLIESIILGIALAMDAFSISVTNGINDTCMKKSKMITIAGVFALFQILMPLIGWICVHTIAQQFEAFSKLIPWIALVLLLFIGGKMLIEGIKGDGEEVSDSSDLSLGALIVQGIATSIDALSTGFTIADYSFAPALCESLIIGIVTFVLCMLGLILGKKIGMKLSEKAMIVGGLILIGIGLKIFIEGVFF